MTDTTTTAPAPAEVPAPAPAGPAPLSVVQAISRAMQLVHAVGKNGRNEQHNYAYRSIDDLMSALNPAMSEAGVVITTRVLNRIVQERTTRAQNVMRVIDLEVEYTVWGPDGSSIKLVVWGESTDASDKATNKALVAAYKYMLMQLFVVPTEDLSTTDTDRSSPERPMLAPAAPAAPARTAADVEADRREVARIRVDLLRATEEPDADSRGRKIDALLAEAGAGRLLDYPVQTPTGWRQGRVPGTVALGVLFQGARRFAGTVEHGEDLPVPDQPSTWDSHPDAPAPEGVDTTTGEVVDDGTPREGTPEAAAEEAPAQAATSRRRGRASSARTDEA